jgi:hypothetical protein
VIAVIEYEKCGVAVPVMSVEPTSTPPVTSAEKLVVVGAGLLSTMTTCPSKYVPVPAIT